MKTSNMRYLMLYSLLWLSCSTTSGQLFTVRNGAISNANQSISAVKKLDAKSIHKADIAIIDSVVLAENAPERNQFFLLAGWLGRTKTLQQVPYEYRRTPQDQNNYDLAMIRVGDQQRIQRLERLLGTIQVNDEFVYTLLPKLLYTRRKEVIDFIFDEILQDKLNCKVADPHTSGNINCAYRLLEAIAPIIINFPIQVSVSGDLDVTDYPAALALARDWIRTHKSSYQIDTSSF